MEPADDPIAEDAYDALADQYAETVRSNPYNAHLEFPATTALIPDIEGKRVLDAGCGTGVYTEWLLEEGAESVVGVDGSEEMLAHARDAVGDVAGALDCTESTASVTLWRAEHVLVDSVLERYGGAVGRLTDEAAGQ